MKKIETEQSSTNAQPAEQSHDKCGTDECCMMCDTAIIVKDKDDT